MTPDHSRQAGYFFSSNPTAVSPRCDAVLELGKKLTNELGLEPSVDTLGRWMAHYIAELICEAEQASSTEKPAKLQACFEAILNIWAHRYAMPNGQRPFEEIELVIQTIESLNPENGAPRYFREARSALDENAEMGPWLTLIDELDHSARILTRFCLTRAAHSALDKSMEWVALAEAAGADNGIEFPIIRMIDHENEVFNGSSEDERDVHVLVDRKNRLERFITLATALVTELQEEVQAMDE